MKEVKSFQIPVISEQNAKSSFHGNKAVGNGFKAPNDRKKSGPFPPGRISGKCGGRSVEETKGIAPMIYGGDSRSNVARQLAVAGPARRQLVVAGPARRQLVVAGPARGETRFEDTTVPQERS